MRLSYKTQQKIALSLKPKTYSWILFLRKKEKDGIGIVSEVSVEEDDEKSDTFIVDMDEGKLLAYYIKLRGFILPPLM